MHAVTAPPANEADINQAAHLLNGEEKVFFADAGYTGMDKRPKALFLVAAKPSKIRAMKRGTVKVTTEALEKAKASVRALVEHPIPDHQTSLWVRESSISGHREKPREA